MSMQQGWQVMRSMSRDSSVKDQTLADGTTKRVMSYARPYRGRIAAFLVLVVIDAVLVVATPLILKSLVDDGVVPGDRQVVVRLAVLVAGLALLTAIVALAERWLSSRIGEGLIYDLRTQVFGHVLRQPIAFFTRAQTGALVSRLGQDVIGAQQAFTSVLSNTVSNAISLVLILVAMASLSWQLTLGAVLLVPLFLVPAKLMGRRLADLSHQQMGLNADLSSRMTERFNVAGALLVKLFGRPATEDEEYAARAAGVRDIGVRIAINRAVFFVALTTVASLATAMVYGFGHPGDRGCSRRTPLRSLRCSPASTALHPISNVRVDIMTALVSSSGSSGPRPPAARRRGSDARHLPVARSGWNCAMCPSVIRQQTGSPSPPWKESPSETGSVEVAAWHRPTVEAGSSSPFGPVVRQDDPDRARRAAL